jgi:hypothetical protein
MSPSILEVYPVFAKRNKAQYRAMIEKKMPGMPGSGRDGGFWFLVSGSGFLVPGFWFLVSGFWFRERVVE